MSKKPFLKYFLLVFIIISGTSYIFSPSDFFKKFLATFSLHSQKEKGNFLFDDKGSVSQPLKQLLVRTSIPEPYTFDAVVEKVKEGWLRGVGMERYQLKEREDLLAFEQEMKSLCAQLGYINDIFPKNIHYKYGIILGATISTMRKRLGFLNQLLQQGVQVEKIVVLVGQRPRFIDNEPKELLITPSSHLAFKSDWKWDETRPLPATETELAQLIYEQSEFCESFLKTPIIFVDAPMIAKEDGSVTRPTTESTITTFLKSDPEPGTCLCISTQPYVPYQDSVVKTHMPSNFITETVGMKAGESTKLSDYLDSIARTLIYDQKRLQLSSAGGLHLQAHASIA